MTLNTELAQERPFLSVIIPAFNEERILHMAGLRRCKICEVPINWYYGKQSKVSLFRDGWQMLKEIAELKKRVASKDETGKEDGRA